jgi:hypothetical protein
MRVALVRAALDAGRDRTAMAAAEPILPGEREYDETVADQGQWVWAARGFLSTQDLSNAERVAIAQRLAGAYERADNLAIAASLLRVATEIDRDPEIAARLAAVAAELARRHRNLERHPVLSPNLEQPAIVRPMLAASKRGSL